MDSEASHGPGGEHQQGRGLGAGGGRKHGITAGEIEEWMGLAMAGMEKQLRSRPAAWTAAHIWPAVIHCHDREIVRFEFAIREGAEDAGSLREIFRTRLSGGGADTRQAMLPVPVTPLDAEE